MEIPKDMIVSMIESRQGGAQAQQAAQQLPDQVDHEQHAGLLSQFGIDPQEAVSQFSGGQGQGGQPSGGGFQEQQEGGYQQGGGFQDQQQGGYQDQQQGGYQDQQQGGYQDQQQGGFQDRPQGDQGY